MFFLKLSIGQNCKINIDYYSKNKIKRLKAEFNDSTIYVFNFNIKSCLSMITQYKNGYRNGYSYFFNEKGSDSIRFYKNDSIRELFIFVSNNVISNQIIGIENYIDTIKMMPKLEGYDDYSENGNSIGFSIDLNEGSNISYQTDGKGHIKKYNKYINKNWNSFVFLPNNKLRYIMNGNNNSINGEVIIFGIEQILAIELYLNGRKEGISLTFDESKKNLLNQVLFWNNGLPDKAKTIRVNKRGKVIY